MRILLIGDINGRPGRRAVQDLVPRLRKERAIDFAVANAENAADGFGITPEQSDDLLGAGIDCLTSGNHIWDREQILPHLTREPRLLRPLNYPSDTPGGGLFLGTAGNVWIAVINLMGRVFMPPCDNPFTAVDVALKRLAGRAAVILVDMHAEATSEKMAMGWHLDGRVSAVVGTHTHVQTADETVLPGGTAYITDLGMTGPYDSVIGIDKSLALKKFLTGMPVRLTSAKQGTRLCGVIIEVDDVTGRAGTIERLQIADGTGPPEKASANPV